ncbi:MAG: hypothetical protein IAE91_01525 [Ignavibacteriaceae bacterium]|nr:hypothetical protein [Ignavibacteriaceae bacterium]
MSNSGSKVSAFKEAVINTPDVKMGYMSGLNALNRQEKIKINLADLSLLEGSLDIDESTRQLYPNENRWDYAIGYAGKIYFVEFHSASSKEVKVVIAKLNWLKKWLKVAAPIVDSLKSDTPFHWIQSGNFKILKDSKFYRQAAQHGILPKPKLNIP